MASHSFPDPIFESLLEKLVHILEITQRPDSRLDPQTRQALFQAVGLDFARQPGICLDNMFPSRRRHLKIA